MFFLFTFRRWRGSTKIFHIKIFFTIKISQSVLGYLMKKSDYPHTQHSGVIGYTHDCWGSRTWPNFPLPDILYNLPHPDDSGWICNTEKKLCGLGSSRSTGVDQNNDGVLDQGCNCQKGFKSMNCGCSQKDTLRPSMWIMLGMQQPTCRNKWRWGCQHWQRNTKWDRIYQLRWLFKWKISRSDYRLLLFSVKDIAWCTSHLNMTPTYMYNVSVQHRLQHTSPHHHTQSTNLLNRMLSLYILITTPEHY